MIAADVLAALKPVVAAFEQLNVAYLIGGSLASSVYGVARSTLDADLMADLLPEQINSLVTLLQADYYLSEPAMREALTRRSSFNLIHLDTMIKIDIFIPKGQPFDRSTLQRKQTAALDNDDQHLFHMASPEDIVLLKLEWYKLGGNESTKQWRDIVGVLRVQANEIDLNYLQLWAETLTVVELLEKALVDAGLK